MKNGNTITPTINTLGHSCPYLRTGWAGSGQTNSNNCGKCYVIRSKKDKSKTALVMGVDNSGEASDPWSMEVSNAAQDAMGGQLTQFEWQEITPGYPGCQN